MPRSLAQEVSAFYRTQFRGAGADDAAWWLPRSQVAAKGGCRMKKLKHEAELFKAALLAGVEYAEGRKAVEFESTDSAKDKALYIYRLLVHDKVISPMPEEQVGEKTVRHRLATWYAHQLPQGHPLLE
jgi:hypothetical protein